jgi:hypothetical protein
MEIICNHVTCLFLRGTHHAVCTLASETMNLGTYVSLNLNPTLSIPIVDNIGCTVSVYVSFCLFTCQKTHI